MVRSAKEPRRTAAVRTVVNTNGKQYLVHWKGYDEDENTREPAKIMEKDAPEAVKDYKDVLAELGESPMDMDSE